MFLEIRFISGQDAIEPRQYFLCTVIGMQDDRNAIERCNSSDVVCSSNSAGILAV
jgi:hypothetical protein